MTPEERLAHIVGELNAVGVRCLVMGGHAVRHYGLVRSTTDFDLQAAAGEWDDLPERLARTALFTGGSVIEGPSWRPGAFRRFRLGALPDGRDEWLEFWKENHLLPGYEHLEPRSEAGVYAGRVVRFLGLADLIRSKETERDADWQDVAALEQFLDERLLARVVQGTVGLAAALASLRSRAGFEGYLGRGFFADVGAATAALKAATTPMTQAYLLPVVPVVTPPPATPPIEPVVVSRLRAITPASPLHLSLVEVVRRRYVAYRKDLDRADKEAVRARGS